MDKHLEVFVLAHVVVAVLIYGSGIAGGKAVHRDGHGLLVAFHQLGLAGVCDGADAGRQHVIDRLLVVVLFDIDRADGDGAV